MNGAAGPCVAVVVGTRPEAIKLAPLVLALRRCGGLQVRLIQTGQHKELLEGILPAFGLSADVTLDCMAPGQSLAELSARALQQLEGVFAREQPACVVVQGDTTTAFCAALAAFYRRIPVWHIEAGLRTGDLSSPWPEEANRAMLARIAFRHSAPTAAARENLLREGIAAERISVDGNTVIDALLLAVERVRSAPPAVPGVDEALLQDRSQPLVLVTAHRRENVTNGALSALCRALRNVCAARPELRVVWPVHRNPAVLDIVERELRGASTQIVRIEPQGYLPFVRLMERAALIVTDSGGIQEEAPSLRVPVLVVRDTTERPEAVASGAARRVGIEQAGIEAALAELLDDPAARAAMCAGANPYGDGHAAERIAAALRAELGAELSSELKGRA